MALLPQPIDFTDKDFDSLRLRLQSLVRSTFPTWTDFNVANFGNILLEMFSYVGSILTFYQDNQAREAFIADAQLRRNLIALAKLISFEPTGQTAATVTETITLLDVPVADVTFLKDDVIFRTADITGAIEFQLLADLVLPGGTNPPTITATIENSKFQDDTFTATDLPNQEFQLTQTPFLLDLTPSEGLASPTIVAGNGAYTVVDNLLSSGATDRDVAIIVDENDQAIMRFGNGINGAIPTGTITADYKTGGGAAGNVEATKINRIVNPPVVDGLGNSVTVSSVSNALDAAGGANRQSNESIRINAPLSLRTQNRTVSRDDYEINALLLAQVSRALALSSNEDTTVEENEVDLYIIPAGGGTPTQALKDQVETQVTETFPNTITVRVNVLDTIFLTLNFEATIFLAQGANGATVRDAVVANLTAFLAIELPDGSPNLTVDYGFNAKQASGLPAGEIALSDLFNVVRDTTGVRKIGDLDTDFQVNNVHRDVVIENRDFPKLGTVILTDGDTNLVL